MNAQEISRALIDRLQGGAGVRAVYGDPVVAGGKTIVPVARVAFGFGGGFGRLVAGTVPGGPPGESAGAGGGVAITPVGVIEITPQHTRLVDFGSGRRLLVAALAGLAVGLLLARRR